MQVTPLVIVVLGMNASNSAFYAFAIAFANLLIATLSPILSGIADYSGRKKWFLRMFTTMGSISCLAMLPVYHYLSGDAAIFTGIACFILAAVGFGGSWVFYNAYLPEIVTEDQYDRVSARGFMMGYLGSTILMLMSLVVIRNYDKLGFSSELTAIPVAFAMVGIWWISFSQITFRRLPPDNKQPFPKDAWTSGFRELKKVWEKVKHQANTKRFLLAFFAYSAGVQTIIVLAATFAEKELNFGTQDLIILLLILQYVGLAGAYLFARVSEWKGNIFSLLVMLFIWISMCVLAYFIQTKSQFYGLAAGVGLVMGGIQSLSRSTYAKLIPMNTKDTASYFSFYDVLEKVAIVLGTFSFGFIDQLTGGMRNSILALIVFFATGIVLLWKVRITNK
mgnify:CR=1 FL=1